MAVKKLQFKKNNFEIYEPDFCDFWGKINFKTFYVKNYSQKVCSRSILNDQVRFWVCFTWRRLLLTLLTSFCRYNAFGCIYILLTLKNKKKKSVHQLLYFGDMFLDGIYLDFCKNQETFILTWILFFHFPVKLVLPAYGPFSWSASHILYFNFCM